jgi:hypothetical protein
MWVFHLSGLHGGKHLGNVLQRHYLGLPGLRGSEWTGQPVETFEKHPLLLYLRVGLNFKSSKYTMYSSGLKFSPALI